MLRQRARSLYGCLMNDRFWGAVAGCALFAIAGCAESRVRLFGTDGDGGTMCGSNVCAGDEACCTGCDGETMCSEPGGACPAIGCPECGDEICEPGAVCCDGCAPDESFCSSEEGICPQLDCPEPIVCANGVECDPGGRCCAGCDGAEFCVEARAGCPDVGCPPPGPCRAMRVQAEGDCRRTIGYFWTGFSCAPLTGCDCIGPDCNELLSSRDRCEDAFRSCSPRPCNDTVANQCEAGNFCAYPRASVCGENGIPGACVVAPEVCPDGGPEVCGCDGRTYFNACEANQAGVDVEFFAPCDDPPTDDCRVDGCDPGENCQSCSTGFFCLPIGTVCLDLPTI